MGKEKVAEDLFVWTDQEIELLLESVKAYAAECLFEGKRSTWTYDSTNVDSAL